MRYRGGVDVDGICRPCTEVVFRGRKLHCGPWTEVVSHATPPHLVKVKINFDEAQKLTWKEIKCFYGLKTITTPNHITELLKMQLESKNRNVHTYSRGPVAGSFQSTLWPRRRASHPEPTQPFFQFLSRQMHKFSHHTTTQKEKEIYSISLEISHKPNSTVFVFNKSKISIQTLAITWIGWLQEPFDEC